MAKIQFGTMSTVNVEAKRQQSIAALARKDVKGVGLEHNGHTVHSSEAKFENVKIDVNVARVKDDGINYNVGVAKGDLLDGVPITMPTNNAAATVQALKKRADYAPSLESMDQFNIGYAELMKKTPALEEIRVDQELIEKYLLKCSPSKAAKLREAALSAEWSYGGDVKHAFAKQETLLKEHRAQPRIVYQGGDLYNLLVGTVVMELNDRMKKVHSLSNPLNTGNKVIYACGASGEELGDIIDQARGEPIESDAKNNDGSQSAEFRKPEAMYYRKLGAPVWFVREFAKCTEVRVWTRYGIKLIVKGERLSGEGTTTTGNSFVHFCLMLAALVLASITESTNIHGGDDYLGFVEGDPVTFKAAVEKVYVTSGMVAEVVPQESRDAATFYRKRYLKTSTSRRPVPQFGRAAAKLNLRANQNSQIPDNEYMSGKYLSAAYEHRHTPVIRDILLQTSARLSANPHIDPKDTKVRGVEPADITDIVTNAETISDEVFGNFLDEIYGITPQDLVDVYSRIANSCVDYCEGWTYVDKLGYTKNKKNTSLYQPKYIDGAIVDALVARDV